MCLVYQTGTIIPGLETLDRFFVVFIRLRKTFDGAFGGVVLDGVLKAVEWRRFLIANALSKMALSTAP